MTNVAIHCSSHLAPTEHSTLIIYPHFKVCERQREKASFLWLHYMPFNSQLFIFNKSAAVKPYLLHIRWKKGSRSLSVQHALHGHPDKSITIYNAWDSSQRDYL